MKQWYRKSQRDLRTGTDTKSIWKFSLIKDIAKIENETEGWNDSKSGVLFARKKKNKAILLQDTDQRLKGKLYYI